MVTIFDFIGASWLIVCEREDSSLEVMSESSVLLYMKDNVSIKDFEVRL